MLRCPESCKMKKMHLEGENNKLRRELMLMDDAKNNMEKQNRMYEQEVSDAFLILLLFFIYV